MSSTQSKEKTPKTASKAGEKKSAKAPAEKKTAKAASKPAEKKPTKSQPKQTAKETSKPTEKAKPKTAAKQTPKAKTKPKQAKAAPAPVQAPSQPERKTYAQRAVERKNTSRWVKQGGICGVLAFLAYIFKYRLAGYGFSALVCMAALGVVLFYALMNGLTLRLPRFTWWATRIFTVCLTLGLIVCAVTEGFIVKAALGSPKEALAQCRYVVVLGAKVRPEGPSVSLWDRIYGAEKLLKENPNLIAVVSGGQGPDEVQTEAACMYENLVDLGIDPSRIWMEDLAESTAENIAFSLDMIEEKTGQRPACLAVLSSEYHLLRASLYAKQQGVEFVGVPAITSRIPMLLNHAMREVAGVWHWILLEQ